MNARVVKSAGVLVGVTVGTWLVASLRRWQRKMNFRGLSVVITGGSRGLGLEMARQFAAEGARLALLARDEGELERARKELQAGGADVVVFRCDIGNREDVDGVVDRIAAVRGGIDVLVNNAGIIQASPLENLDLRDFEDAMAVHAWGPLYLVRAAIPRMKRQGGGRIVNISSIGGVIAVPHLLPYTMSKFALTGLSEGLRVELARYGILVTTVVPGLMRTGSHVNALFKGQHEKEFAWFSIADSNVLLSARSDRAARQVVRACRYGDPFLVITLPARLAHVANAVFPSLTAAILAGVARLLPKPAGPEGNVGRSGGDSRSELAPPFLTRRADRMILPNNEAGSG